MREPIAPESAALPQRIDAAAGLDANALELFARVVQAGSFARAARKLGQERAAVSRRVAAIEALVGQPLFARTTRSLGLTEAGRRLAHSAKAVLDAAEAARSSLRSTQAKLAGRLRITCGPSLGRSMLAPVLAEFQQLHPPPELRTDLHRSTRQSAARRHRCGLSHHPETARGPGGAARAALPHQRLRCAGTVRIALLSCRAGLTPVALVRGRARHTDNAAVAPRPSIPARAGLGCGLQR